MVCVCFIIFLMSEMGILFIVNVYDFFLWQVNYLQLVFLFCVLDKKRSDILKGRTKEGILKLLGAFLSIILMWFDKKADNL